MQKLPPMCSAEVNIKCNITKILNNMSEEEEGEKQEYASKDATFKICTEKRCLHQGVCTKNLCNHPENLVKMANFTEQGISGMLSKILLLVLGSRDLSQAEKTTSLLQAEQFTKWTYFYSKWQSFWHRTILNEFFEFTQLVSIVFLPKLELNQMIKEPMAES